MKAIPAQSRNQDELRGMRQIRRVLEIRKKKEECGYLKDLIKIARVPGGRSEIYGCMGAITRDAGKEVKFKDPEPQKS